MSGWMDGWLETMLSFQSRLNCGRAEVKRNEVGYYFRFFFLISCDRNPIQTKENENKKIIK